MKEEMIRTVLNCVGMEVDYQPMGPIAFYAKVADIFGQEARGEALKIKLYNHYESNEDDQDTVHGL